MFYSESILNPFYRIKIKKIRKIKEKKGMQTLKNKTVTIVITLILTILMSNSIILLPTANADATKTTYPIIYVRPSPVGVGQNALINFGLTDQLASALYGWTGITITVTAPDGIITTLGPFTTDATGTTSTLFTPNLVGNYTFVMHFPQQVNPATTTSANTFNGIPAGTVMLSSTSDPCTLVVQQEPLPSMPQTAMPTEYWTRPINGQLQLWSPLLGNWLTATNLAITNNRVTAGNYQAPQSAHILWRRPLPVPGGLVGGALDTSKNVTNVGFENGDAYEGKFSGSVIMDGNLYYTENAVADVYKTIDAVNLRTGELLWAKPLLNNLTLTRGQELYWGNMDNMGVYTYLWATANSATLPLLGLPSNAGTTWCAFDPITGQFVYALYSIPSGNVYYGPRGEIEIYTVNLANGWMTMWNSTNIPLLHAAGGTEYKSMAWSQWQPMGKVVNGTGPIGVTYNPQPNVAGTTTSPYTPAELPLGLNGYMWNVTIPKGLPGSVKTVLPDRIIGLYSSVKTVDIWAISTVPGQAGQLLYNTTWTPPADWASGNVTIAWQATSDEAKNGVLILGEKETRQDYGFSLETGQYLWVTQPQVYLDAYNMGLDSASSRGVFEIYNGLFITGGYGGIMYAYNITNGNLVWTYTASNPYAISEMWANWPLYPMFIANGMIYAISTEHSGNQPLPRGAPTFALNATTGKLIWRADGLFRGTHWGGYPLIGDSVIALMNTYDQQVYAIGTGPSATTVQAPMTGVNAGSSLVIQGTVMDVSPGTKNTDLKLRFPNGVPAASDAGMSDWMKYVYEQFTKPANATGVPVSIDAVDPNGNYIHIGDATSDASGLFSYSWQTPNIPGKYTITATFAGSNSYIGSAAEIACVVEAPQAAASPYPVVNLPPTEMYIAAATAAIVVAIAIGFAVTILVLRKRL